MRSDAILMTQAIIFIGGTPRSGISLPARHDSLVIAADSGLAHAIALGLAVDIVVGDLDSVDPAHLETARAYGATIEEHPTDKDATDFELALATARSQGVTSVVVVGGTDGRFDHAIANVLVLAAPQYADLRVIAHLGEATLTVIHDQGELTGEPGETITLLPVGGPAHGVTTSGLHWPLHDETLAPGSARGVSNTFIGGHAQVTVGIGTLLAIQPGASGATA